MHKYSILTIILSFLCLSFPLDGRNCHIVVHDSLQNTRNPKPYIIVIDPGHGGKDGGCTGSHSLEKNIVLSIGKKLRSLVNKEYRDVEVILTREKDEFIPLHERASLANHSKADLFISIHCNAIAGRASTHGSETYVLGLHRAEDNLEVAKRENAAILMEDNYKKNYDGFDPTSSAGHIILSMYQNAHLEQSIYFANLVEHHLTHHAQRSSRGVKQAGFLVLRETTMPSVLIETGFLTNKSEEAFLNNEKGQWKVAESILKAIKSYVVLPADNIQVAEKEKDIKVNYGIQLASTSQPLSKDHQLRKQFSDIHELKISNHYKYIIKAGANRKSAENKQNEVRSMGYKDAFIIPWPDFEYTASGIQRSK